MASATSALRTQLEEGVAHLVAAAVIVAAAFSVEGLFGFTALQTAVAGLLLVAGTYVVSTSESELSFPFIASFAAVLLALWQFVLDPLLGDQVPVEAWFAALGIDLTRLDAATAMFIAAVSILGYWTVSIRAGSGAKSADTVAKRLESNVEKLVETYATMGRLTVTFLFSVVVILASELGVITGDLVGFIGDAPLIASNLFTAGVGYLSLGGSLPYLSQVPLIGALAASEFGVLVLAVIVLAVGVKHS